MTSGYLRPFYSIRTNNNSPVLFPKQYSGNWKKRKHIFTLFLLELHLTFTILCTYIPVKKLKRIAIRQGFLLGLIAGFICSMYAQWCTSYMVQVENVVTRSSENVPDSDNRDLLFVGVMTAEKYLSTRVVAAYNTWVSTQYQYTANPISI